MKYLKCLLFGLLFSCAYSQDYWVNEYDLADRDQDFGSNITLMDNKIIVTGGLTCDNNSKSCHKFSVFDSFGNLEYYTTYDSLIYPRAKQLTKGLVVIEEELISIGYSVRSTTEVCIISQNIAGEVTKRKFLKNPYDSELIIEPRLISEHNGAILLFADIYGEQNLDSSWGQIVQVGVFRIDPNTFDVIDQLIIKPEETIVNFMDAKVDNDGSVYIALDQRWLSGSIGYYSQILHVDSLFNSVDSMIATESTVSDNRDRIVIDNDNNILMSKKDSGSSNYEIWIFNFEEKSIEKKTVDLLTDPNWGMLKYNIEGIEKDAHNDVYVYGRVEGLALDYTYSAFYAKLDANYDFDTERIFITNVNEVEGITDIDGISDLSKIYDIFFASDENVYITGYINDSYGEGNIRISDNNILLAKLDKQGCVLPDCEIEQYIGGRLTPDHLILPNKTWHIYNEATQETYRYKLSADSTYIQDRYYLELFRSDTYDGEDFYTTGMYMRERSHLVYLRRDEEDFFIYNFDLGINGRMKSWIYERFEASHQLIDRDSIYLENGEYVRKEILRCSIDEDASDFGYYNWIEGVGDTKGLLAVGEACIEGRNSHLLCAYDSDGNLLWDNPDFDGCWVSVATKDEKIAKTKVTPNPTLDYLYIEDYQRYDRFEVRNIVGGIVHQGIKKERINIHHLQAGIYTITMYSPQYTFSQKIIKL